MRTHILNAEKNGVFGITFRRGGKKGAPQETREVFSLVSLNVPETLEEFEEAFSDYSTTIGTVKVTGVLAALSRAFVHAAEATRGEIRKRLEAGEAVSDEEIVEAFAAFTGPGRGTGRKTAVVSEDDLDRIMNIEDPEERQAAMKEYLRKQRVTVTAS